MRVYYTSPTDLDICEFCGKSFHNPQGERRRFCSRACYCKRPIDHAGRFWKRIRKTEGCWLWTGATLPNGYGHMNIGTTHWYPHRYAWTITNGPIPDGLFVCHDCPSGDNPLCCRPDHLFLGTNTDNVRDMWKKGRGKHTPFRKGAGHILAKLDDERVRALRREYASGRTSYALLAAQYAISVPTVASVVNRKTWKHIAD